MTSTPLLGATMMSATLESRISTSRRLVDESIAKAGSDAAEAALTVLTEERAVTDALLSDSRRARGEALSSLDGVPITWKDVFDVEDEVTTAGSESRMATPPAVADSWVVRRARSMGLVTVGKTNLSEFAFSGLGINQYFGTPRNPNSGTEALVPGGSSSGAAVAVAAGVSPLAVGTDTSGSIRIPAAFCGLVGFKASSARYGPADFEPLSRTLDSVGIIARSTEDVSALDSLLAWYPYHLGSEQPVLRAVIPEGEWIDECSPEVYRLFTRAVRDLRRAGMNIEMRPLPSMRVAQDLMDRHGTIVGAEAFLLHEADLQSGQIEAATRRRLVRGIADQDAVAVVYRQMGPLRRQFSRELAGAALLCPTVRHLPPAIAALAADPALYDAANALTLRTTMLLSYLGTCGISLPLVSDSGAASTGLLVSMPEGSDGSLLELAGWTEGAINARHAPFQPAGSAGFPP
ncbi:amidase family protein [Arthrobacter sp. CAN_C5]|uniref:amidase family protein n=1 Tax=Arthrobacter sp. CAN_C5 TaxID=2760706 RepID=UPI001AE5AC85|nr:amidase family protein [Arthrobacter sp. CAN_C5]MBP2216936.1 aspartyl-tRNA(Asn)/glutamyl-tRNA(Gln) amidotransferase subunit A [Arthrobacter sp. CAN_C5]